MQNPAILLIICEGKETEPQYFEIVKRHRRINNGVARVKIIGDCGQHKKLIDLADSHRNEVCRKEDVELEEVEVWGVFDEDNINVTFSELEKYSAARNVNLAFSSPMFELFLLQHFKRSATNATGRELESLLSQEMNNKVGSNYNKNDLSVLKSAFDSEPALLEGAIANCTQIENSSNSPFTSVHHLLQRLLDLAP